MTKPISALQKRLDIVDATIASIQANITAASARLSVLSVERAGLVSSIEVGAARAGWEAAVEVGLPIGTVVQFAYGRAETRKQYEGVVLGFRVEAGKPTQYSIQSGEGFDTAVYKVTGSALLGSAAPSQPPVDETLAYVSQGTE